MSIPLGEVRSRAVVALEDNVEKKLIFRGFTGMNMRTRQLEFVPGPVDLSIYGTYEQRGVNPRTNQPFVAQGITLHVSRENGADVDKPLNIVSKDLMQRLRPDLQSGDYLKKEYTITAVGVAPATTYTVSFRSL